MVDQRLPRFVQNRLDFGVFSVAKSTKKLNVAGIVGAADEVHRAVVVVIHKLWT